MPVAVGKCGIAGGYEQIGDQRQARGYVLSQAVAEIALLRIACDVIERKHGDRRPLRHWYSTGLAPKHEAGTDRSQGHQGQPPHRRCRKVPRDRGKPAISSGRGSPFFDRVRQRRLGAIIDRRSQHRCREYIAAAGNRLDDAVLAVVERDTDIPYALRQRFIGHRYVWPDRVDDLVPGEQAAGTRDEDAQDIEALRAQFDVVSAIAQGPASHVEQKAFKFEDLVVDCVHCNRVMKAPEFHKFSHFFIGFARPFWVS
jgi:hypothetical protein